MPHPRLRRLLPAALLPVLLAACGSESPSAAAPDGISTTTVVRAANGTELALVSGGGQAGAPGQPLAEPVVVRVRDRAGRPLGNRQVVFIAAAGADVDPRLARTDADGYARTTWTLGPAVGTQSLRVSGTGGTLVVAANAQAGSGARIFLVKRTGDERTAAAGAVLPNVQAAVVRDDGRLVAGAVVTFTPSHGGRVSHPTMRSNGKGLTQVRWTLGPVGGAQTLTASTPGAQPVTFTATATGGRRPPSPATLQVLPDSMVIDLGASAAFTAVIRDSSGAHIPGPAPAWSSSHPAVATVDSVGTVRGAAAGTATITATLGALSASATVRVRGGPASIQVVPDSLVLDVGAGGQLSAVLRDAGGAVLPGPAPAWSSSAPAVATVDAQGRVRGVAPGTATVTASVGALSATARVRVRGGGPSLQLFPDSLVLDIGVWGRLFPVARDASGRAVVDYHLVWSTSADQVVFVDGGGNLLPLAAGTARITARWGTLTASVPVRVRPVRGGSLTIPQIQKRVISTGGYIDPSTRDVGLKWWIHVSQRNVSAVTMRIRSPQGRMIDCTNADAVSWFRDEFSCQLTLPRGSEPGVWRVDRVTVTKDGQTTVFTGADLDAMGTLGRGFSVLGTGADTEPPRVSMLWPHQGTRYPDIYYVEIGTVDHVSGVRSVRMTFRGPGGVTHSCDVSQSYGALARVGGGVCRLPLRPGSGTWDLVSVDVEDGAGNRATYTPAQIAALASGMSEAPFFVYSFTP